MRKPLSCDGPMSVVEDTPAGDFMQCDDDFADVGRQGVQKRFDLSLSGARHRHEPTRERDLRRRSFRFS
jgi:hypothetical protein